MSTRELQRRGLQAGQARLSRLQASRAGQVENQPDGMELDEPGNLHVAHLGMRQVQVVSPEGKVIRRDLDGNLPTSNVAFADAKIDKLFVTGGNPGALFRLDLGVGGLTILPAPDQVDGALPK